MQNCAGVIEVKLSKTGQNRCKIAYRGGLGGILWKFNRIIVQIGGHQFYGNNFDEIAYRAGLHGILSDKNRGKLHIGPGLVGFLGFSPRTSTHTLVALNCKKLKSLLQNFPRNNT